MADDGEAEIISLFPKPEGDPPLAAKPDDGKYCWHRNFSMDGTARRVYCRDCGREVPAFDALDVFRKQYERYAEHVKSVKGELKRKSEELENVKREVRNAKAQKRRLAK